LNLDCGNLVEFSPCAKELNSTLDQSVATDMIAHTLDLTSFAGNFGRTDCTAGCAGNFDTDADVDGRDLFQYAVGMP
jgi:hypothetical protein